MNTNLFDEESDSGGEVQLGTNKEYAKSYNTFRQKELLKKLKDQDGSDSGSDSESDSSDDENAFNPKFDEEFYKALASLKQKDPKIYDKDLKFFEEDIGENSGQAVKEKKAKPLTVKEYEAKVLLEKGGIYEDDEDADGSNENRPQSPTYNEEQKLIKNEFKKLIDTNDSEEEDEDENWGGIFKKREKTKDEKVKEDEEHEKWLADPANAIETSTALKPLKDFWANPRLSKDEVFLRDYILTNGYAEKDVDEIPTYDEIVGGSGDEEDFEQKQIEFEHKYNFRFEDPDQEFIKRYPRTIEQSVRKTDDRRKLKRVEVRDRKQQEKEEKFREIEILKGLKRNEIEEKIKKLKAVVGDEEISFNDIDLEAEFDPDAHDKRMKELFNKEYYDIDEGEEKPEAPSDIEDLQVENYDEYDANEGDHGEQGHCEDDDFNMDCDYDLSAEQKKKTLQQELIENSRDKRKRRKRKSKFMEMLECQRPAFNPDDEKTYGEYLDEYYKLDCEDVVADIPCRFKYVETAPNDFGLTIEEILMAKNKELNAWASMKKATTIRPEHVERNEQEMFKKKARNEAIKRKILCSLYEEPSEDEEPEVTTVSNPVPIRTQQKKTEKKKAISSTVVSGALATETTAPVIETVKVNVDNTTTASISKNKKRKLKATNNSVKVTPSAETRKTEHVPEKTPVEKPKENPLKRKLVESTEEPKAASVENKKLKKNGSLAAPTPPKKNNQVVKKGNTKTDQKNQKPTGKGQKGNDSANKKSPNAKIVINKAKPDAFNTNNNNSNNNKGKKPFNKLQKPGDKSKKAVKTNGLSDERLKAFGINPKKFQKKLIYGGKDDKKSPSAKANSGSTSNAGKKKPKPKPKNLANTAKSKDLAHKNKLKKFLNTNNSST